jgi:hypothetical protein
MEYSETIETNKDIVKYFKENPLLFNHFSKTTVNLNKLRTEPPYRALRDESTSCFVSTFFKDEDSLNYFIYYNFQVLHYFIMANINELLKTNNEVLKSDEEILVIFKGGNVIHFYFNKIIEAIKSNLQPNTDPEYINKIDDLNKQFKTSDVDTSVYIINNSEPKYNLIYYYVSELLVKSLLFIRDKFDKILNKDTNCICKSFLNVSCNCKNLFFSSNDSIELKEFNKLTENLLYIDPYNDPKYDLYVIHTLYKNIATLFEDTIKQNNSNSNFINKLLELISFFYNNSKYLIFRDSYIGSRYISVLQLIKFYYESNKNIKKQIDSNIILKNLISVIDSIIKFQDETVLIVLNNKLYQMRDFYSKDKLEELLYKIIEKLNSSDYMNKMFYNQQTNPSTVYEIKNPIQNKDVIITPKQDFLFRSANNIYFNNLIMFPSEATHYISINNIITSYNGVDNILSFDLYRLKFNIKLNKIFEHNRKKEVTLNIPSEFLDVSISKYYDKNLCRIREKLYSEDGYMSYFSKLDNNRTGCYNVLSTNLKYSIKDLNYILYEITSFPWNDNKYNKRIIRLLFLIFIVYYKKAVKYNCVKLVDIVLDKFFIKIKTLSDNILLWVQNQSDPQLKKNILDSINSIIFFDDSNNNLLNKYTLANFFDYQNKLFFKIKYYDLTEENKILDNVFHGELDLSINIITKIIFYLIEDKAIYKEFIKMALSQNNYVFSSKEDKQKYIDETFQTEYIEFIKKFVENITFMKELIFDYLKKNSNIPIDDLLLGGSKSTNKYINTNGKYIQFINSKFIDIPFKCNSKSKFKSNDLSNSTNIDLDDFDMGI